MSVDSVLQRIREVFGLGIQSLPGYRIADGIMMATKTKADIDSLPNTHEGEESE